MKNRFLILTLLCLIIIGFCSCNSDASQKSVDDTEFSPYSEITDGLYFERFSSTEQSIFFAEDLDNADNIDARKYVIQDKFIIRYGYCDSNVAYHWNELSTDISDTDKIRTVNTSEYSIKKDFLTVYNIQNGTYIDFSNQKEFNDYCKENNLSFDWQFSNGFTLDTVFKSTENPNWEIAGFSSESLTDYVIKDNTVLYEGYISDFHSVNDNVVYFRLQIPDKSLLEFQDSDFKTLNISFDKPVGKYKTSLILLHEDVYYDKYILIDAKKDEFLQFSDKNQLTEKLSSEY